MPWNKERLRKMAPSGINSPETKARSAASNVERGNWLDPLRPTQRPTTLDIAWAAGIYEGEGSCLGFRRKGKPGWRVQAVVSQKDPELLHRMRAFFGGSVAPIIYHRDPPFTMWRWSISGCRARGFLMTIFCMMTERRKNQIRKAIGNA
jgi:hypothetical protein